MSKIIDTSPWQNARQNSQHTPPPPPDNTRPPQPTWIQGIWRTHTALAIFHETISNAQQNKNTTDRRIRYSSLWRLQNFLLSLARRTQAQNTPPQHISLFHSIFSNFISNRTASIRISHLIGPPITLNGVPEGVCLWYILLNSYTSDISPPSPGAHTTNIAYADDITQVISNKFNSLFWIQTKSLSHINTFKHKGKFTQTPNHSKIQK